MAAATAVSLPEDVIRDILLRVDHPAALFRCAVACKRWSRLVADVSSLRRDQVPCGASSTSLAGIFFTWKGNYPFVPTPRSIGHGLRRSLDSLFRDGEGLLDEAVPLISRQGLLLVRLADANRDAFIIRLAVYNLLTGVCHMLPPLRWNWGYALESTSYAIVTRRDYSASKSSSPALPADSEFLKVLIMGVDKFGQPRKIHTFTSGEVGWRSEPGELRFDTKTCGVSLTEIVLPTKDHCSFCYDDWPLLGVNANRMLTLLYLPKGLRAHIYTRQELDRKWRNGTTIASWLCTRVVELKLPRQIEERQMHLSVLGEKGGTLLLQDNKKNLYTANLETGVMEEVTSGFPLLKRWEVVLLETDWSSFFISRFGGD
ncbi:hypothetical protein QYE76_059466 [Lolium multiflorum]|uniref:F-box domain-containing protein n=1 Tax=Lolium multiflorum TaxID=4521 RepID=A0AAD8RX24_LOLMU|nr:hypothetical protein QYE76_059466 [Lolium multiflorum]